MCSAESGCPGCGAGGYDGRLGQREGGGGRPGQEEVPVTPPEDLMREHAVLSRLLLIYEKALAAGPGRPTGR
jgi:hypothetical protein